MNRTGRCSSLVLFWAGWTRSWRLTTRRTNGASDVLLCVASVCLGYHMLYPSGGDLDVVWCFQGGHLLPLCSSVQLELGRAIVHAQETCPGHQQRCEGLPLAPSSAQLHNRYEMFNVFLCQTSRGPTVACSSSTVLPTWCTPPACAGTCMARLCPWEDLSRPLMLLQTRVRVRGGCASAER